LTVAVLSLQSEGCVDPARVGGKAARLAAALQRGLPVLAGIVVPVEVSADLLILAARQIEGRGVHAARLAVMESAVPDLTALSAHIRVLGDDLVVRSSSPLEAAPAYAGAFTSYLAVSPSEVAIAVRGVWASALTDESLISSRGPTATARDGPRMAVLVQPHVHPSFSGTARVSHDHVVTVVAVKGSPAPLLAGWARGETAEVDTAGGVSGRVAIALVGETMIRDVAGLACRVRQVIGDDLIEWAATDSGLVLLQAKRAASPRPLPSSTSDVKVPVPPAAAGVARLVHGFAGTLGDELILPVLLAGIRPESAMPPAPLVAEATRALAGAAWMEAQVLSITLRARSWADLDRDGTGASSALSQLRGGALGEAVDRLASLPAAVAEESDRLLGLFGVVATWLQQTGMLAEVDDIWTVPRAEIADLIAGRAAKTPSERREARRRALLRWEPLVYTTVQGTGTALDGEPASSGVGAGSAVIVRGLPGQPSPIPRMVLVAPNPIPQLAPLLWGASALVTTGGSTAAHLVEVARSLGVAAVLGCNQEDLFSLVGGAGDPGTLVAVDGDSGRVVVDVHRGK
jgi:phosphoenolpyruvate synthase/pyruvate phosphate dikinase